MQVRLKRGWFAPDASFYAQGVHDFAEDWKDSLPSSAEVIEEPAVPKAAAPKAEPAAK